MSGASRHGAVSHSWRLGVGLRQRASGAAGRGVPEEHAYDGRPGAPRGGAVDGPARGRRGGPPGAGRVRRARGLQCREPGLCPQGPRQLGAPPRWPRPGFAHLQTTAPRFSWRPVLRTHRPRMSHAGSTQATRFHTLGSRMRSAAGRLRAMSSGAVPVVPAQNVRTTCVALPALCCRPRGHPARRKALSKRDFRHIQACQL